MAFITDETFTIISKKKYAESQIPFWEQKLIKIEKKQRNLKEIMLNELGCSIKYTTDELYHKNDRLYIYESCTSDGCIKCNKQIPYCWPVLWHIHDDIIFDNKDISQTLQKIGVVNRRYTKEDLKNYIYGCCSEECKKIIKRNCIECGRLIRPSECYYYDRFCSDECSREFSYQCFRDQMRGRW